MNRKPHVTICVPVYNGAAFVGETLAAIARQDHEPLTVLVSDDGSSDGSAEICRQFAADRRFRFSTRPSRLGWVEHCNWLLRRADGDLVAIVSHDDLPEPGYIARLVDALAARPDCALAFADIRVFGLLAHVEEQADVAGSAAERVRAFIAGHFDGTAFHGLIRRQALALAGGLRGNAMDDFAADVSWLGRITRAGGFVRVPEPLYRKRRHAASASMQWGAWNEARRADAWCVHCRELLMDALELPLTAAERTLVVRAVLRRLLALEPVLPFAFIRALPAARQATMVAAVVAADPEGKPGGLRDRVGAAEGDAVAGGEVQVKLR